MKKLVCLQKIVLTLDCYSNYDYDYDNDRHHSH